LLKNKEDTKKNWPKF